MFLSPSIYVKISKKIHFFSVWVSVRVGVSTTVLPMGLNVCASVGQLCVRDSTSSSLISSLFSKSGYVKNVNNPWLY